MTPSQDAPTPVPSAIAVFGEALVDEFGATKIVGGAPFNVARHLQAMGNRPLMVTAIADDANGALIRQEFARYGLSQAALQLDPDHQTGRVQVVMHPDKSHSFEILRDCAYDHVTPAALDAVDLRGWVYFGTLALRSARTFQTWQELMRRHTGPRYFDLNWRAGMVTVERVLLAVAEADWVKVNEEELGMLCDWSRVREPLAMASWQTGGVDAAIAELMRTCQLQQLIVTRGEHGCAAFDAKGQCVLLLPHSPAIQLVDTVGAGDAFSAVMLHGLLQHWDLSSSLQRALLLASRVCEIAGAVPARPDAYRDWTRDWPAATR